MKIIETTFERLPRERLVIGFEGENQRATVRIDCASVFAEYPNATPALIVKPLFADAYPVVVDRNGTDVDWLITSEILSFTGDGEIQLVFYKDEVICKSAITKIRVCRSLTVTGEMPDPVVQWIENANRKLAEVDAQIVELEGMVDTATDAATRAEQSESNAKTAAANAATSAATATAKATEATNAAGTATAKAAEAQTAAQTATNKANAAAESERIATAKAGEATTAATTATEKAEQATGAAQTATEKAGDASASATAAHASATDAASSATAASASKIAAEASETAAEASATQAAQSVQDAGTAAQTAMQKAAEATQSATNAATSATSAATSATTASTKAGEAAQSAQAVEETAEQLAESLEQISQNTADIAEHEQYAEATYAKKTDLSNLTSDLDLVQTSGTIVETEDAFPTFAEDVTAEIVPVQDLHGYDSPWPGGGGKNLFYHKGNTSATVNGLTAMFDGDTQTISVTGTNTGTSAYVLLTISCTGDIPRETPLARGILNAPSGTYVNFAYRKDGVWRGVNNGGVIPADIDENTTINIQLGVYASATTINVTGLHVQIEQGSTAPTEWTPYSNICPISGFDGLTVTRTGKNLVPMTAVSRTNAGITYTVNNDGSVTIDGTATATSWLRGQTYINERQFLKAGTYHLSGSPSNNNCTVYIVGSYTDGEGLLNATVPGGVYDNGNGLTFTLRKDATVTYQIQVNNGTAVSNLTVYPQIELSSTATPYEPYNGIQVELPFGRTVYGGAIDLTTGKLTVTHAHALLNDPTKWVTSTSGTTPFVYNEYFTDRAKYSDSYTGLVCSYAKVNSATQNNTARWTGATSNTFGFNLSSTSITIDDIKAAAQNGEIEIMYPLATPQVYNLTAAQILLLRDYNALWADTGDIINLEYRAGSFVTKKTYDALKEATLIHNIASGAIASFVDGAEMPVDEVTAQINPVQDLHGYENPWPGGGNLNLLDFSKISVGGTHYGMTFSKGTAEGTIVISGTLTVSSGAVAPIQYADTSLSGKGYVFLTEHISGDSVIALNRTYGFRTESERAIAVYLEGNARQSYTETIRVSVYATTQTAWTPYSNICPITGFEGLTVMSAGKNMINPSELVYSAGGNNVWYGIHFPPDTDFVFSTDSIITGLYVAYSDDDEMPSISGTGWANITYKYNTTSLGFNSGSHKWYRLMTYEINGVIRDRLYQLELGSIATAYEPYQGETYEVEFPTEAGTVYGGSLTIAEDGSGVLTVDSELEIFDQELENEISSGLNYLNLVSGNVDTVGNYTRISFSGPLDRAKYNLISSTYTRKMCNMLSHVFSYASESTHWYRNTVLYAFFPTSVVGSTKESVIAYLKNLATAGTPLTFWIPLTTPITYTLTASQIRTLLGENNLWHDANGDISVGYKANTKLYIDNKIAELVARIVNS